MANTYFKFEKTVTTPAFENRAEYTNKMRATLTAFSSNEPNAIQLTVTTQSTMTSQSGTGFISLNEQEQNELIAGILERRGVDPSIVFDILNNELLALNAGIRATGYELSEVHPNND